MWIADCWIVNCWIANWVVWKFRLPIIPCLPDRQAQSVFPVAKVAKVTVFQNQDSKVLKLETCPLETCLLESLPTFVDVEEFCVNPSLGLIERCLRVVIPNGLAVAHLNPHLPLSKTVDKMRQKSVVASPVVGRRSIVNCHRHDGDAFCGGEPESAWFERRSRWL